MTKKGYYCFTVLLFDCQFDDKLHPLNLRHTLTVHMNEMNQNHLSSLHYMFTLRRFKSNSTIGFRFQTSRTHLLSFENLYSMHMHQCECCITFKSNKTVSNPFWNIFAWLAVCVCVWEWWHMAFERNGFFFFENVFYERNTFSHSCWYLVMVIQH